MGQEIEIPFSDRSITAYQALPENSDTGISSSGVLVLHAWWGLNDFIRELCDRLAAEGFTALAPDLYDGEVATTIKDATALRNKMDRELAGQEILTAVSYLQQAAGGAQSKIGLLGFSLGAYLGMGALEKCPDTVGAVALFYGGRRAKIKKTRAAFLAHFAENDPYVSEKDKQALADHVHQAGLESLIYEYPGTGHWFFEDDRPEAFQPAAAQLAWQRTIDFLNAKLGSS